MTNVFPVRACPKTPIRKVVFVHFFSFFRSNFETSLNSLSSMCSAKDLTSFLSSKNEYFWKLNLFFSMSLYDKNHHNYMIFKETKQTNALVYVLGRELNLAITRLLFCRKFWFIWNLHFLTDPEEPTFNGPMHYNFKSKFWFQKCSLFPCMSFAVMKRAPFFAFSGSLIKSSSEVAWDGFFTGSEPYPRGIFFFWAWSKMSQKILSENFRKIPKP